MVGDDFPHHGPRNLEVATIFAERVTACAAGAVVGLDVVALGATVVVVVPIRAGPLGVERGYFGHFGVSSRTIRAGILRQPPP